MKRTPTDEHVEGAPVAVLGTNVDGDAGTIAADGVLQIAFDRYLLPSTITRQSYAVLDHEGRSLGAVNLKTLYDPVARIVTIAGPDGPGTPWLDEGATYYLELPTPADAGSDLGGFRAIDRAPLARPREYRFRATAPTGQRTFEPAVDFCADVLPVLTLKCNGATCHGGLSTASNAVGLGLTTPEAIERTAKNQVARGANTGPRSLSPAEQVPGRQFGVDMAIVKPNDPGSSWLLYKVELAPPSDSAAPAFGCGGTRSADFTTALPVGPGDRARLADHVAGSAMPFPSHNAGYAWQPLTFQEREKIRLWITQGAEVHACAACAYE